MDYATDPTQPKDRHIKHLRHAGQPMQDDQEFLLAAIRYRTAGGGGCQQFAKDRKLFKSARAIATALTVVLKQDEPEGWQNDVPWRFQCLAPVQAIIRTSPDALAHLDDIAHLNPQPLGQDEAGFARIRLTL